MPGEQQPQGLSPAEQAAAALFDQTTANAQAAAGVTPPQESAAQVPQRPDNVPEKFWDAEKGTVNTEALLQSYRELESKGAKPPEQTPPQTEGDPAAQSAEDAVKAAKLDMGTLQQEFDQTGTLSDASFKALEAAGIDRATVDLYIAGRQAVVAQLVSEAHAMVGGEANYTAMVQWAAANLSPAEQATFDSAVNGSNKVAAQMAITALNAKYTAASGSDPKLLSGQSGATLSEADTPFASTAEMVRFMQDPKYRADPAYRRMVERRAGLTDF